MRRTFRFQPAATARLGHAARAAALLTFAALLVLGAACAGNQGGDGEEPAVAAEPQRVENPSVDLAVVIPPGSPFELESNQGDEIRLRFPAQGEFGPGTVIYQAAPEQYFGVNLVDAVNDRKAEVEELPGGQFLGQIELGGPLGPAYSTRARYTGDDGKEVEEVRIFTVHPAGNRLLYMTYRYDAAAGQTKARMMDQAFEAFGYIEPLEGAAPSGDEGGEGAEAGAGGTGDEAGTGAASDGADAGS